MDKKNITQIILVIIFVALILISSYYFIKSLWWEKKPANIISASGRIEGDEYNAASKLSGKVEQILVDEGNNVKKGRLLACLDSKQLQAQVESMQQEVVLRKNRLYQAELALGQTRTYSNANIDQARSNLKKAKANLDYAEKEFKRYEILVKADAVSRTKFDAVKTRYISAREEYDVAKLELDKVLASSIGTSTVYDVRQKEEEVKNARAMLKRAKAMLESTQADLGDSKIYSPITGTVVGKIVEPGEVIASGTPIVTIVDMDSLYLRVFLPTDKAGKLRIGNPAKIIPDALGKENFKGIVYKISDKAEFTPKNVETKEQRAKLVFEVKIKILNNKERKLKPGMPAEALIDFNKIANREP